MDLREKFVLQAMAPGSNITALADEAGISRKTGYKWISRFAVGGVEALLDMSRRPARIVQTTGEVVLRIAELREAHPKWGPKKLRELLRRENPCVEPPSVRTIDRILIRLGEARLRRPRRRATGDVSTPSLPAREPNDLWTFDFKGWWLTARTRERCEPFTARDAASRYLLELRLLPSTTVKAVQRSLTRLFQQYGLPKAARMDNGSPFGCTRSPRGLTRLTAWLVSLGIEVHFGRPAHPQDNGGHERMHRDVRAALQMRPAETRKAQQHACDVFRDEFNTVRPHEALAMKTPSDVYTRSPRPFRGPRTARYPPGFEVRLVSSSGSFKLAGRRFFVGHAIAGQQIGIDVDGERAQLWLYELELGEVDLSTGALAAPRRTIVAPVVTTTRGTALDAKSAPKRAHSTSEPETAAMSTRPKKRVTPSSRQIVTASTNAIRRRSKQKTRKKIEKRA